MSASLERASPSNNRPPFENLKLNECPEALTRVNTVFNAALLYRPPLLLVPKSTIYYCNRKMVSHLVSHQECLIRPQ